MSVLLCSPTEGLSAAARATSSAASWLGLRGRGRVGVRVRARARARVRVRVRVSSSGVAKEPRKCALPARWTRASKGLTLFRV